MDKETIKKILQYDIETNGSIPLRMISQKFKTYDKTISQILRANNRGRKNTKPVKKTLEDLKVEAKIYWEKNSTLEPAKNSSAWLLIPKFGADMTAKILAVQSYLKTEPQLRKYLFGVA